MSIYFNEKMYPIKENIVENWLYFAFAGFNAIKPKLNLEQLKKFAAIGTGNGVDALGAHYIFEGLEKFYLTDIDPEVLGPSVTNFYENKRENSKVRAFALCGNHTESLEKNGIKVDLLYANLPNIPLTDELQKSGFGLSTFHFFKDEISAPKSIDDYFLSSQYQLLKSCKDSLNKNASVIIMEGGRFPVHKFDELFNLTGFNLDAPCVGFKPQTEATEVISSYAMAERDHDVDFIFYDYEKTLNDLEKMDESNIIFNKIDFVEKEFFKYALTATQALREYKNGRVIGHTCHVLRGTLK